VISASRKLIDSRRIPQQVAGPPGLIPDLEDDSCGLRQGKPSHRLKDGFRKALVFPAVKCVRVPY
jgi:hypothetical protein